MGGGGLLSLCWEGGGCRLSRLGGGGLLSLCWEDGGCCRFSLCCGGGCCRLSLRCWEGPLRCSLFFRSALSRVFRLNCPVRSTLINSSFGFPVLTSTAPRSSGTIFCWLSFFICFTLSIKSGYCLLLSGNTYHIRFLKISFFISRAVPFAT